MTPLDEATKPLRTSHSTYPTYAKPPKVLEFDPALFIHHLDSWDATDDQKAEYLELIWQIVVQFVDLGFGIHTLSAAAQQTCGQLPQSPPSPDRQAPDVVNWRNQNNREATTNAGAQARQKERSHVPGTRP